jgi:hypothetical protein
MNKWKGAAQREKMISAKAEVSSIAENRSIANPMCTLEMSF